ncbi:MAG: hypothetical protein LBL66_08750 [Clostridiales bacterium]|jgi:hypothetical protein|nr:hypothetical protein [Clostridiales bacterium]
MIFVDNNAVNQITDDVVYVTSGDSVDGDGYSSGIGSDGRFYRFTKHSFIYANAEIHVFDSGIKQWVVPTFDDTLIINHNEYAYGNAVLHGGGHGDWIYTHYTFINGLYSYTESIFGPNFKSAYNTNVEIIDTNIFRLESGSVNMYAFDDYNGDALEWLPKTVTIPDGVALNTFDGVMNDVIYATGHTATTTSRYQIYIGNDGNPKCDLLNYAEYNANIIVLQPLN